jgi:hypothetical protein
MSQKWRIFINKKKALFFWRIFVKALFPFILLPECPSRGGGTSPMTVGICLHFFSLARAGLAHPSSWAGMQPISFFLYSSSNA